MDLERLSITFVFPDMQPGGAVTSARLFCQALLDGGASVSALILGGCSKSAWAAFSGIGVTRAEPADLATADLVVLSFWNRPEVHAFIRADHPPMRVALRPHVEGNLLPHVITREVADFADVVWTSAGSTLANPNIALVPRRVLHLPRDLSGFPVRPPVARQDLVAGYLGTVDFVKLHADYVSMSAAAGPGMAFELWGAGGAGPTVEAEAKAIGRAGDFRVMGTTGKPAEALHRFDIFGYPLCDDSYAANDATLQEAMAVGLPCVVLDHPGNRDLLKDGETALVARSPAAYSEGLARLGRDPGLRSRLGANAAQWIRRLQSTRSTGDLFAAVAEVLAKPKRKRHAAPIGEGAALFVASLGDNGNAFERSLSSLHGDAVPRAERDEEEIAASGPGLCNAGAGGLFNYRAAYPDDPVLRYWTALVFARMGRLAVAYAELHAARRSGLNSEVADRNLRKLAGALQVGASDRRAVSS